MNRRRDALARLWLVFSLGMFLACAARVAQGQRPDVIWKAPKTDGYTAPKWVHDVVYASASSAGYGAARLVGMRPTPAAITVTSVGIALHLRMWAMGTARPSADWAFDVVTRGGPALVLAACESNPRRWCLASLAALTGAYFALLPYGSP